MSRLPWLAAGLMALVLGPSSYGQDNRSTPVLIYVTLPADAKLAVDGVPVKQTGAERKLITPPIKFGEMAKYTLTATYTKDGKTVSVVKDITIEGGKVTRVDLSKETPASYLVFDLLVDEPGKSLIDLPLRERRERLEELFEQFGKQREVRLSPSTRDFGTARRWLTELAASGFDGVVEQRGLAHPGFAAQNERAAQTVARSRDHPLQRRGVRA